jgi:hypothetical protein
MDNLVIIQHQNTLQYATIQRGGYWPQVCGFKLRNYVYL